MPKVSVILTSYNKPKWIGRAIESVLAQDMESWELFIADDNSNRETRGAINAFRKLKDKRLIFYQSRVKEEKRYQVCRYACLTNIGIRKTTGKYLSYMSDDVIYYPHRLRIFSSFLDDNLDKDICYGEQDNCTVREDGEVIEGLGLHFNQDTNWAVCRVDHSSFMHRRNILKNTGLWPTHPKAWSCADAHFFRKIAKAGYRFYFIPGSYEKNFQVRESIHMDRERRDKVYSIPWEIEEIP